MVNKIDFELPSFYITEPLVEETFEICRKDTTSPQVIKKLYMIKNEVKPDYYFADTGPETGFLLTALDCGSKKLLSRTRIIPDCIAVSLACG